MIQKTVGRQKKDIKVSYDEYVNNMKKRGLQAEVKPFDKWVRKIKDPDDSSKKITVAGDSGESKTEKFSRLGTDRLKKALKAIKALKNLSGSQYEHTPEQIDVIEEKLQAALDDTISSFGNSDNAIEEVKL